ncbi:DUF6119 family protein [Planotetraspora mira]|uniref:DUF6119 family protein n=1 Tax=Planotetraspora mira TaxID=58121 RepID=UPI00194F1CA5|nr:DUF6119 family protein [Planotetraspora mira]
MRPDALLDAVDLEFADIMGADLRIPTALEVPALWVDGCLAPDEPVEWCADASLTTGLPVAHYERRSGGLLVLAVDDVVYAVGFGTHGRHLLADEHKDPRFGLQFAVRAVDPYNIHDLVRRFPAARGRSDFTHVPAGLPVFSFGLEPAEIVRRLGGGLDQADLTFRRQTGRTARVEGSSGLRLRLALSPADLIADIRAIAETCARRPPHVLLEFVDQVQPVSDRRTRERLDAALEKMLSRDSSSESLLALAAPTTVLTHLAHTQSYLVRIPGARATAHDHLQLETITAPLQKQPAGNRVQALKKSRIQVCASGDGKDPIAGSAAIKWLEATCSIDSRRFHLLDGHWYEISQTYLDGIRGHIVRILSAPPSLDLPGWAANWTEGEYNKKVPGLRDGYVCLDRKGVRNPLNKRNWIEICDLLGPNDELIHVKKAEGSSPLSHLFYQALVSAQVLAHSTQALAQFAELVARQDRGRTIPDDFQPKKIVLAILLKGGEALTADTLFPFSQITLAHTAIALQEQYHVDLEVIAIPARQP